MKSFIVFNQVWEPYPRPVSELCPKVERVSSHSRSLSESTRVETLSCLEPQGAVGIDSRKQRARNCGNGVVNVLTVAEGPAFVCVSHWLSPAVM